ncbi:hypothetical protein DdX_02725 [Ditylenchus destructor]|uniref:Uncharacterized protein n=1 Tax=Ditylenchus destructor TaxID=166010 RepID=A0AAD4RCG0_9BILA|nr:hypothetical protein DdX_02725 [Ditylenchus destructor]
MKFTMPDIQKSNRMETLKNTARTLIQPHTYKYWDSKEGAIIGGIALLELLIDFGSSFVYKNGAMIRLFTILCLFPILLFQGVAFKKMLLVNIYLVYNAFVIASGFATFVISIFALCQGGVRSDTLAVTTLSIITVLSMYGIRKLVDQFKIQVMETSYTLPTHIENTESGEGTNSQMRPYKIQEDNTREVAAENSTTDINKFKQFLTMISQNHKSSS